MNKEYISLILVFSIVITIIIDYIIIKIQQYRKLGQIERLLGPKTHRSKNKTPTLGGIGFILTFIIMLIISKRILNLEINLLLVLFPVIAYSILGIIDDFIIVITKNNDGISSIIKLLIQILIAGVYFFIILTNDNTIVTFFNINIDLKWLYGIFILFLFTGFTNATNLTDGIDGLLAGCSIITLFGIFLISLTINIEISYIILLFISTLLGFLVWNYPVAKVFMGNIGAYTIGAFITTIAILLNIEIYLLLLGIVFILETLSVVLQVSYFKYSKGKRIFKMAPLHHHFELIGYSEKEVLHIFYIIQIIFVFITVIMVLI